MGTAGKVVKCKAAIAWEEHKPLTIEEIEVAPPKDHEVRIKILASGVCGTDSAALKGKLGTKFPAILGHEAIGVVESIGKGVTTVKPGDKVIPLCLPQCRQCRACKNPNANLCVKNDFGSNSGLMHDNTSRFTCKGKQIYHFLFTSTFTEYSVIPEICIAKVNPAAPDEVCIIGCGFATGYGAAVNAKIPPGSTCAVFGLGGVGFSAMIGCKIAGAGRIIGVGSHKDKFPKAIELGATECLSPKDYDKPIQEVIREKTNGGVDFAFECSGNIDTMKAAFESTYIGNGVTVVLGVAGPNDKLCFHPGEVMMGRTIKGLPYGGFKSRDDIPKLVCDYMAKKFNLEFMVSQRLPVEKINEAFELMASGKGLRNLIIF
ncbi:alcohol dehydrogenase 1A (class I), alpha polypeptide S homeolog [Xenopus laevis]|uniref:Alcohol dehydrogenase 1A (Class I), alpha polypeptide S homeolog n=1 Tax=Xenopus laevis TaxID=8355 RepID=Q4R0Y8_XENLA|nr:alcohol dehydrogenase 1A (class I), alpha polypeptide S homeolog [Xenopus laevis]CAD97751.1 alcohol dehydrogenase class 8 [Xenopus laevis]